MSERPTVPRRALAGALGLAATPPAAAVASNPDAELIAACGQFAAIEAQVAAALTALGDDDGQDRAMDAACQAQEPFMARILELRATTLEGFAARARALVAWNRRNGSVEAWECWDDQMRAALLRDLVQLA